VIATTRIFCARDNRGHPPVAGATSCRERDEVHARDAMPASDDAARPPTLWRIDDPSASRSCVAVAQCAMEVAQSAAS
jgi:hypothetical protein